ncbi:hypothetical protein D3C77_158570 [compost metagenome]
MRQVQHGDQNLLAIDPLGFHPDDVVGQGGHLLGAQAHPEREVQRVLAGDGVVHQVTEHRLVGGQAFKKALAGTGNHGLLDQVLFVEAVAQALGTVVGVVAEFAQQVIRTHELLEVSECRVGFNQVFVRAGLPAAARQALDFGDANRACHAQAAWTLYAGIPALSTRHLLLALSTAHACVTQAPALRTGATLTGALPAEAKQAVLAARQFKSWQRQRVDLLLRQFRR